MSKAKKTINWLLEYPAVVITLFYVCWLVTIPGGMIVWGLELLGAYLLITVLGKRAGSNEIFLFIAGALAFLTAVPAIIYTLLAVSLVADYGVEKLTSGFVLFLGAILIIASTYKTLRGKDSLPTKIIFAGALPLMLLNILYFSIFYPTIEDTVIFQGSRYHIVHETNDDFHSYQVFYKCNLFGVYCKSLYASNGYGDAKIIIDNRQKEISLFEKSGLRYTHGIQSRYYEGNSLKSGNQIYELGWYCNQVTSSDCDQVDYVLYQCNLDYTGGKALPIQSTSYPSDSSLELRDSEETAEILLVDNFDDDLNLVFAYGEHPRCYVKGCEILDQ